MADDAKATDTLTASATALEGVLRKTREGVASLTDVFVRMGDVVSNAFGNIGRMVGAFNPAAFRVFNAEVLNLNAAIGSVLLPVLERATGFVRRLNEVVTGMSPPLKAAAAALAAASASAVAFGSVLPTVVAAVTTAARSIGLAIDFLSGEISILDVLSGGILPIIGAIATVAIGAGVGFGVMGDAASGVTDMLRGLASAFKPVMDAFLTLAAAVTPSLGPMGDIFASLARTLGAVLLPLVRILATEIEVLGPIVAVLAAAVTFSFGAITDALAVVTDVMGVFADAFKPIQDAVSMLFRAVSGALASIGAALTSLSRVLTGVLGAAIKSLAEGIVSLLRPLIEGVAWIIDQLIRTAVLVDVIADRFARAVKGEVNLKGVMEEADRRVAAMKAPTAPGPKPYTEAGGQATLISVDEVSRRLQAAGFAAGQKKDAADEVNKAREDANKNARDTNNYLKRLVDLSLAPFTRRRGEDIPRERPNFGG